MKKIMMSALVASTLLSYAETALPPQPVEGTAVVYEKGKAGMLLVDTVEVSAKVVSIDTENRKLRLLGPDGKEFDIKVGPEAKKFDQIKLNDLITITMGSELDIAVYKDAEARDIQESKEAVLLESEKPGVFVAETVTITADVIAIDKEKHTATLKFKDGNKQTYTVREDVDLSQHKVGEVVVLTLTEAVAINVENIEK